MEFKPNDKVRIKGQTVVRTILQKSKDGRYKLVGKGFLYAR